MNLLKKYVIRGLLLIPMCLMFLLHACESNDIKTEKHDVIQPDLTKESGLEYFYPDSGGIATQLVLKGYNLGNDTSLLKVTVNGKNAKIVGANKDFIYAIVPTRADTGLVKVYLSKGDQVEEFVGDKVFKYQFKRNVSTVAGVYNSQYDNEAIAVDGPYATAKFRRPWGAIVDKEGAIYIVEEGIGQNRQGALRKLFNGNVETLAQNNTGPFQSPTAAAFSINQDTMFIANWSHQVIPSQANIIYSTRDMNFMQWKNYSIFPNAQTGAVAVNPVTGELFFTSQASGKIYKFNKTAPDQREELWQVNNATDLNMKMIFNNSGTKLAITIRNRHCIFVADYNTTTRTMSEPKHLAGEWGTDRYANGFGAGAIMSYPVGIVFDEDDVMYFADRGNHIVRKATLDGEVSLWAGVPGVPGNVDGEPDQAKFTRPEGIAIFDGALYVTDYEAQNIRKIVVE